MSPKGGKATLTAPILLRMTPELHKALEALAKANGSDLSDYIRGLLQEHVREKISRVPLSCGLCGHVWEETLAAGATGTFTCPKCRQATITLRRSGGKK